QFAFCASTWEALTRALPFGPERIAAAVLDDGDPTPPSPSREAMPRWVEAVLRRGLAARDRFASMEPLLDALSRDPTRVWTRRLAATAIVTGMVAAFGIGSLSRADRDADGPPEDPCSGGAAVLESAWPSVQREAAFSRVAALGAGDGATVASHARERVEAYGARWISAHRDACLAHRRGEHSDALLDRRMACLHRGSTALQTFGEVVGDVEANAIVDLAIVVSGLPDPDRCGDLSALTTGSAPPPAAAGPIGERLAAATVLRNANRLDAAQAELDRVVADARALEYGPLLAETLLARGVLLIDRKDRAAAATPLREAVDVALASGAVAVAVEAWGQLEWVVATGPASLRERPLEGRALMLQLAEQQPLGHATMSLYNNLAGVEPYARDTQAAAALLRRAIDIARHLGPAADRTLASALGNLAPLLTDPGERDRVHAEAVARWTAIAGPEHPRTLRARGLQAIALTDLDASITTLTELCALLERSGAGASGSASNCAQQLALAHELQGHTEAC
ncbi:MAG: hypothetical protein JNK45_34480, partial [Myxococcales bacterium]|nr:hypothetical protein [Myxococcales bacterium]